VKLTARALVLGLATGGRSASGVAALALTTVRSDTRSGWEGRLGGGWGRGLSAAAALGELVVDKSPRAGSRLAPPALTGRVVAGLVAGATLARRSGARPLGPALVAAGGVLAGSVAGARWRAYAASRGWNPLAAALAEDVVVIALAAAAARR
jgi:uncharacterized membrane protein